MENNMFQMKAMIIKDLRCPKCGEQLTRTSGQFADLYEHSQQDGNVYESDLKRENDRVNYNVGFSGFKSGEVKIDKDAYENQASYKQTLPVRPCENDGKYIVLKRTVISATTL